MKWERVKFGDLYAINSRNGLSKPSSVRGAGYKMINMGELFSNDRIYDIPMELVPLKENEKISAKVEVGDLLFARQSLVLEGAGKCSIVMEVSPLTVFESHLIRVRLTEKANSMFYYYYFRSPLSPIKSIVSQCAQSGIRGSDLQELEIPLPPLPVQKKIAGILSCYDDLIENCRKQIALLEEAAARLYRKWFAGKGEKEGWTVGTVDSKVELLSGYAFQSSKFNADGAFKIVTIKNVQDGKFDGENVNRIAEIPAKMPSYCKLDEGDILLSLTGNVGRVCMVNGENYLLNQRVAKLKSRTPAYTYCLFRSKDMFDKMNNLANGVAQQNLSPIRTGQISLLLPPDDLIEKFEELVKPMMDKIATLQRQILLLATARDLCLPRLMSGRGGDGE